MDQQTIEFYNSEAENVVRLHSTLTPQRIYQLISRYFVPGGKTVDIGCGTGRDTHWLNQQGFPTFGIDGSVEMLKFAQSFYPGDVFLQDYLPDLKVLSDLRFQNILCSAVLMHLSKVDLKPACDRLLQLLDDNGCLIISFRGTNEINHRENGKLYESILVADFVMIFNENGCDVLVQESELEISRNLVWHNVVICNTQKININQSPAFCLVS
ncbi:MAG: class I SAM-dependent methyltransferase [Methylobacter sp.]|nr:class I SAM-dependent methyltransferase [Methylobacter sp.]